MLLDVNPGDYLYPNVTCLGVYDGDTVYLDIDAGFHGWRRSRNSHGKLSLSYRLLDIDAPELRPLVTRAAGEAAREFLSSMVLGQRLIVKTLEDADNFGRYLVWIWLPDGTDVNGSMLAAGMAVPYQP